MSGAARGDTGHESALGVSAGPGSFTRPMSLEVCAHRAVKDTQTRSVSSSKQCSARSERDRAVSTQAAQGARGEGGRRSLVIITGGGRADSSLNS